MQSFAAFFRRMPLRSWLLLGVFLLLWKLDYAPFWNPDEGRYSSAALEMARPFDGAAEDWTVPHLDTIPRLNKPPLVYWMGAVSYKAFGPSERAARLVPALAAVAVMFGLYFLGRSLFGERAAIAAALVWATSLLPAGLGRTFNTDMLLTASMFFAFGGIFLAGEEPTCRYSRIRPYLWAGAGMGAALLAKGPVGVALPLLIGGVYLTVAWRWRNVSAPGVLGAIALTLLIGAPWYFAIEARMPGFAKHFLVGENLDRFSGKKAYHEKTSPLYYLPIVLLGVMPWSGFWLTTMTREGGLMAWRFGSATKRLHLYCWLWALLLVGFFSLSGTKLISYVLPAFPAFALLLGEAFGGEKDWEFELRTAALGMATLLNVIVAGAAGWYLTNDKTLPAAAGLPYAIAIAVVLLGTVVMLWIWREDRWRLFCAQSVGAAFFLILFLGLAGRIAPYEDASPMLMALVPHVEPEDTVVEYRTFQPSAIFYLQRPVPVLEFNNNSGLDETHPNFKKLYRKAAETETLRNGPNRVFALTRWNHNDTQQFTKWTLIGRNNDFRLYCNRAAPADFRYEFTAPKKRDR